MVEKAHVYENRNCRPPNVGRSTLFNADERLNKIGVPAPEASEGNVSGMRHTKEKFISDLESF